MARRVSYAFTSPVVAPSGKPTRVDALLGKETDEEWAGRLDNAVVDVLSLDQWEAQKSRLRRTTIGGRELAVSLDRGIQLQDGDILLWDEQANTVVVARINLKDVLEIDLSALVEVTPEMPTIAAVLHCADSACYEAKRAGRATLISAG